MSEKPFGLYIHVPFCSTRCGYCDFNTYTAGELGQDSSPATYLDALEIELEQACAHFDLPPAQTVFIGGGTPSLLGSEGLSRILSAVTRTTGLAPSAEVTTESNPESTSPRFFEEIRAAGFNRVSLGMQSYSSRVLKILERAHTPGRALEAADEARDAGFEHVNLDLIYGTPGETDDDVHSSINAVLETGVDHVSAYSLIVEDGTAMARRIRRGELVESDDETLARRYELIDEALAQAGFAWYEVSNWAKPGGECEHNLIYWRDGDWWGAGPGAHGHLGNTRYVNVKHPARYTRRLGAVAGREAPAHGVGSGAGTMEGELPLALSSVEKLTELERYEEFVMLGLRLAEGIDEARLTDFGRSQAQKFKDQGLLWQPSEGRIALTSRARLLADGIIADILVE